MSNVDQLDSNILNLSVNVPRCDSDATVVIRSAWTSNRLTREEWMTRTPRLGALRPRVNPGQSSRVLAGTEVEDPRPRHRLGIRNPSSRNMTPECFTGILQTVKCWRNGSVWGNCLLKCGLTWGSYNVFYEYSDCTWNRKNITTLHG